MISRSKNLLNKTYPMKLAKIKKAKIPKSITLLFFVLAFMLGIDLGYTKSLHKRLYGVAKTSSLIMSCYMFFVLSGALALNNKDTYWMMISFLSFSLNFIIIKWSKYNVYQFLLDIHSTDSYSVKNTSISIVLWLYSFVIYLSKMVFMYLNCVVMFPELCDLDFLPWPLYALPVLALDWMYSVLILIYSYIYYCIKDMQTLFEIDGNIINLKYRFVAVARCYDKIRPLYEKMVIVAISLDLPKIMGLLYNMLKYYIVETADIVASVGEYTYAFHIISNITASGAMLQFVVWKVDALIMRLHDVLLKEKDPRRCKEIARVVHYLKARQLRHPLMGVIPVDMRLPAFMLGFCSTYLIVLIQFTHLFD